MAEVINVKDTIEVSTEAPLQVNLAADRVVVRTKPELGLTQVSLSDSWQVVPYAKRITMDYELPESISQGLFVDVQDLKNDLLQEIGNREVAIIGATTYAKDYADGIEQQVYSTIDAAYIGSVTGNSYILKNELLNLALEYDTGTGLTTGTLQEIFSRTIAVENNQATYDTNLQSVIDSYGGLLTRTEDLEVSIDGTNGLSARLSTLEGVAAGVFTIWYGAPQELLIGMVKFTDPDTGFHRTTEAAILSTDVQWQYLGGTLGENSDGWVRTDAATEVAVSALSNELLNNIIPDLQSQIDGEIASWFYSVAPGPTVEPELTWVTDDTANGNNLQKLRHIGDMYYDDSTSTAYRYSYTEPDAQGTWTIITDTAIATALANAATAQEAADRKILSFYNANALPPTADGIGDLWVVSDVFYDPPANTRREVRRWNGSNWVTLSESTDKDVSHGWAGGASKLITGPNGEVTGWSFADGSLSESTFGINADNFYIQNSNNDITNRPFAINGNDIVFNGSVSFNNLTDVPSLGSTPEEVIQAVNSGQTTAIDGAYIGTGTVLSNAFFGNIIYNLEWDGVKWIPATSTTYKMKIDLQNGEIHIK